VAPWHNYNVDEIDTPKESLAVAEPFQELSPTGHYHGYQGQAAIEAALWCMDEVDDEKALRQMPAQQFFLHT
jgi:hypothetical protein